MNNKTFKVMIDAGHYGKYNQSPVVKEYYESDMTWKLQMYLKEAFEQYENVVVSTTRKGKNTDLAVYKRGLLSEDYDLFLSLHSDACDDEKVDRVTVFCPLDERNNSHVLGKLLADSIADLMNVSYGKIKTREGKSGEYYGVLRGACSAKCPMYFLIEHGFHTNPYVAKWLLDDDNLKKLAELEADIIAEWYGLKEKFILGDVNGDGKVSAADYILAKRICFNTYSPSEEEILRCDIDGDGKVTAKDYILIKRICFGTYKPK